MLFRPDPAIRRTGLGLFSAWVISAASAQTQVITNGWDAAANYSGFDAGANQGFGFGACN